MSKYTIEDYIVFIEQRRWDKISHSNLELIAKIFREMEERLREEGITI